jgi:transposase InsO family protein
LIRFAVEEDSIVGWQKVVEQVEFREEMMRLGEQPGTNIRQLCRRFHVSPKTYYKWRRRYRAGGVMSLANQSRRPLASPKRSAAELEKAVLDLRQQYPSWGARKIEVLLQRQIEGVPARSTIHDILRKNGCISEAESLKHRPWQRFEHEFPNQLWQMDFKGWSDKDSGYRCEPLSVVDDHSRFAVCLEACPDQQTQTVRDRLTSVFRRYGLPEQMVMDNGSPWGYDADRRYTPLTTWLMQLGVRVSHCRPYHPQTQGKVERFHRTLQVELLQGQHFRNRTDAQNAFDQWRDFYNQRRPHQALAMAVPASRYRISRLEFPEKLPLPQYHSTDLVRSVDQKGHILYQSRRFLISKGFRGHQVALRQTAHDGIFDVFFYSHKIAAINLLQ